MFSTKEIFLLFYSLIFFCSTSHLFYIFPRYRFCRSNISDDGEKNNITRKEEKKIYRRNLWWKNEQNHCCQANIFSNQEFFSSTHSQKKPQFFKRLTGNLSSWYAMLSLLLCGGHIINQKVLEHAKTSFL